MVSRRQVKNKLSHLSITQLIKLSKEFNIPIKDKTKHKLINNLLLLKQNGGGRTIHEEMYGNLENVPEPALLEILNNLSWFEIYSLKKTSKKLRDRLNQSPYKEILENKVQQFQHLFNSSLNDIYDNISDLIWWTYQGSSATADLDEEDINFGDFQRFNIPNLKQDIPIMMAQAFEESISSYEEDDCQFNSEEREALKPIFGDQIPYSMNELIDKLRGLRSDEIFPKILVVIYKLIKQGGCIDQWNDIIHFMTIEYEA